MLGMTLGGPLSYDPALCPIAIWVEMAWLFLVVVVVLNLCHAFLGEIHWATYLQLLSALSQVQR